MLMLTGKANEGNQSDGCKNGAIYKS